MTTAAPDGGPPPSGSLTFAADIRPICWEQDRTPCGAPSMRGSTTMSSIRRPHRVQAAPGDDALRLAPRRASHAVRSLGETGHAGVTP
jgi:hypothetical protein